jgi:hypothetical protein
MYPIFNKILSIYPHNRAVPGTPGEIQEWVPTPKHGESSYRCLSVDSFQGTAHTFTGPQSGGEIADPSTFSSACERTERSPTRFYGRQTICNRSRTFERLRRSLIRRVHACVPSGGGHFGSLSVTGQTVRTGQLLSWERVLSMCCVSCRQNDVIQWRYFTCFWNRRTQRSVSE